MDTLHLPEILLHRHDVSLRPLTTDDVPALAAASGESREHYRYNPVPDGLQGAAAYVEKALQSKARGQKPTSSPSPKARRCG